MLTTLRDLGHDATPYDSVEDALAAHHLDWDVELRPLFYKDRDGVWQRVGNNHAVVRTDTDRVLGRVGKDYRPCSNVTALRHVDRLLVSGTGKLDAVWDVRGGRQVGVSVKLDRRVLIAGDDPIDLYVTVTTSHDGSRSDITEITPLRLWCLNQLGITDRHVLRSWGVRHLHTMEDRLAQVSDDLARVDEYATWLEVTGNTLVEMPMSVSELHGIMMRATSFFRSTEFRARMAAQVTNVYTSSELIGEDFHGTAWGALNAVTEWLDHRRRYRSGEARYLAITRGFGLRLRNAVMRELLPS